MLLRQLLGERCKPSQHRLRYMPRPLLWERYVAAFAFLHTVLVFSSASACAEFEMCGGEASLQLMHNPHPPAWAAAGCVQDGAARALTGYYYTSTAMTPAICQSTCAQNGFSIAGIEYGTECYCEHLLVVTLRPSLTSFRSCRWQLLLERTRRGHSCVAVLRALPWRHHFHVWWFVGAQCLQVTVIGQRSWLSAQNKSEFDNLRSVNDPVNQL